MSIEPIYVIQCQVSGGVTGTRQSLYKVDGVVQEFRDRAFAERTARDFEERHNRHAKPGVSFQYKVETL